MERVINDCNYCVGNQVNCLMIIHNIYNKLGVHNFASKEVRTRSLIKTKTQPRNQPSKYLHQKAI